MAHTNSSLKMQMPALKMVIKWDCRVSFLGILRKWNICMLIYLLQLNKPSPQLKHHLFAQESITRAGLSGDSASVLCEVSTGAGGHRGWRTYSKVAYSCCLHGCCILSRDTARTLGFALLGLLFGTTWVFSKYDGWVPRVSVLRVLGSSHEASCNLVSEVPDYPLCLMLLAK